MKALEMTKIVVIPPSLDVLPFHDAFEWNRYQCFCTDVLANKLGVHDCREYLRQGNAQEGIDIYATEKGSFSKVVAQCKLEKYLAPQKLLDLVTLFLNGNFTSGVTEFILCTSYSLARYQDETALENARQRLNEKNIEFTVWDEQGLSAYLRNNPLPHIVYRYFGEEITKSFYGGIWEEYIKRLKSVPKQAYTSSEDYIERTVMVYLAYQQRKNSQPWTFNEEHKEEVLIQVFEQANSNVGTRIILLNVGGFGKTEEINRVAAYFSNKDKLIHPIRYLLRDYEGQPIELLLENHRDNWRNIHAHNLLLLFDALDEIKEQYRDAFINHLNSFIENNPGVHVLVTSRFNFYDLKQPSLRNFDVYVLHPLSSSNIQTYLQKHLGNQEPAFRIKLAANKFSEYITNPYYLTRLVRFYKNHLPSFPQNKGELFDKILFERLEADEAKFRVSELKEQLLPIATKIAFCMTLAGKSSLTNQELKQIVPDYDQRESIRHFSILNQHESSAGSWSFEHKNLQEYLAAFLLATFPFEKIRNYISFSFNRNKLLPRFINTISFLFEILPKNDSLFSNLFNWIQSNQPELFVRFEKEQIDKLTRQEIVKTILRYYKERNITIRVSSNFDTEELAVFADIDHAMITYIGQELENSKNEYAYDLLQLLSTIKRPFVHKHNLLIIYFSILNSNSYSPYVHGQCAACVVMIDPNDNSLFKQLLNCPIDITNFEVRRRLINALDTTSYAEEFVDFVLQSIPIYDEGQKDVTYGLANDVVKRLLLKMQSAPALKKILQYCVSHKNTLIRYRYHKGLGFEYKETQKLLIKVATLYKENKSLLILVYRIVMSEARLLHDDKTAILFKDFFANTCGTELIFNKIYKHGWKQREMLQFASEHSIDFLVNEYVNKKLSHNDAIAIRNRLSWKNRPLMDYYLQKVEQATGSALADEEDLLNLQNSYEDYLEKNQQFLLSQPLFLKEAREILDKIPSPGVSYDDLQTYNNPNLSLYQHSLVHETLAQYAIDSNSNTFTKEAFINDFSNHNHWADFVAEEIVKKLRNKNDHTKPLQPALLTFAEQWLVTKLQETSFTGAIRQSPDGGINFDKVIERIKDLYLLLDVPLDDHLLVKMLEADFTGIESSDEPTGVSAKIIREVKDAMLLKNRVIQNIRSNTLAPWVLFTHFKLCYFLKYYECAADIYSAIISNGLAGHERRTLTNYYLELGGEISDFSAFLKLPDFIHENAPHVQWEWYLLEKFVSVEKEKVEEILLTISNDANQGEQAKIKAMTLLLQSGRKEGLHQWVAYIRKHNALPDVQLDAAFRDYIASNPLLETIDLLVNTLDYAYERNIPVGRFYESVQDFILALLISMATQDTAAYKKVREEGEKLVQKYMNESFVSQIVVFQERLDQKFYENHEYEIPIAKAVTLYEELLS